MSETNEASPANTVSDVERVVRCVPLKCGGVLKFEPAYWGAPDVWRLYRGSSIIRTLDRFESEFVDSAIAAAQST